MVEGVGAIPFVPFKTNSILMLELQDTPWARMYHRFAGERKEFLRRYHKRSNVETAFAMIKGKFGDAVLSKSPQGMANEILAKVLCHNIVVVGQAIHEFGVDARFPTLDEGNICLSRSSFGLHKLAVV